MKYIKLYESQDLVHKVVNYRSSGNKMQETWTKPEGSVPGFPVYHREDGPARIIYYPDGKVEGEWWFIDGESHREGGPAVIQYHPNGKIAKEVWSHYGIETRDDGPAFIDYYPSGVVEAEKWFKDDELHREDGPAVIHRNERNQVTYEAWYFNGKRFTTPEEHWLGMMGLD